MEYNFDIKDLLPIGVTLVVVTIVMAFGLQILSEQKDSFGDEGCPAYWNSTTDVCQVSGTNLTASTSFTGGYEVNATGNGIEGLAKIPAKLPLIASVVVAVVIIGILVKYFRQ